MADFFDWLNVAEGGISAGGTSLVETHGRLWRYARSALLAHPLDMPCQWWMLQQQIERIELAAQSLFIRYELMNRAMAIAAQGHGCLHLVARKSFAKPFVFVAATRNQMMLRGARLHVTFAHPADGCQIAQRRIHTLYHGRGSATDYDELSRHSFRTSSCASRRLMYQCMYQGICDRVAKSCGCIWMIR